MMFEKYLSQFSQRGVVEFHPEQNLRQKFVDVHAPDEYGVYLIYGVEADKCSLVYIGKAGTLGLTVFGGVKDCAVGYKPNRMA